MYSTEICHHEDDLDKISKIMQEREEKAFKYDCLIKKIDERLKELEKLKETYIKLKEYEQVDITLYKIRELNRLKGAEDE